MLDREGRITQGHRKPSSEFPLHVKIYQERPDVGAIVHVHSPWACAYAVAHQPIPMLLEESAQVLGDSIPVAQYAQAGSEELAISACRALGTEHKAVLLANHGLVGLGQDLEEALLVCVIAEKTAMIGLLARSLGTVNSLAAVSYTHLDVYKRQVILNQNRLPDEAVYESCASVHEVAEAIRSLKVRGAPLIGVTAAFGLALGVTQYKGSQEDFPQYYSDIREELASTRPTAVNLFWALQRMDNVYQEHADKSPTELGALLVEEARAMYADDIRTNELIGHHGAQLIHGSSRIMTICNAGALATCGYGTALGVVRTAFRQQKIEQVWACETRPVLQGARLTVWELIQDKIPVKLITDSMAGYIMKLGQVDSIVVGADRCV